jgi:hypothetical protein
MADAASRTGWLLPVLLAIASAVAISFGFLYLTRPNPGELGSISVVVTDDQGKPGSTLRVIVAEAPLEQTDTVAPGLNYTGIVHYPIPYLVQPNLKLTGGKRRYDVVKESELGFTWVAQPLADDFRDDAKKNQMFEKGFGVPFERLLESNLELAALNHALKPGLVFEDFTWQARGLRGPPPSLPPKPFEQKGTFFSQYGQEAPVHFPVPFDSAPNIELAGPAHVNTVIVECTAASFKWRNTAKGITSGWEGDLTWTARGLVGTAVRK